MFNKTKVMDYVSMSEWVEKVIMSCETLEQLKSAERLYKLYRQQTNTNSYRDIHRFLNHTINHRAGIADGGALNHRSLIEKQKLKICRQIN